MLVRIKVKYLLLIGLILAAAVTTGFAYSDDLLYKLGQEEMQKGNREKAVAYLDRLIERFPESRHIDDALYWSANWLEKSWQTQSSYIFSTGGGATSYPSDESFPDCMSSEERYRLLLKEHPDSQWARFAHRNLARILLNESRYAELEALVTGERPQMPDWVLAEENKLLVEALYKQARYQEALEKVDYHLKNWPNFSEFEVEMIGVDCLIELGRYEEAQEILQAAADREREEAKEELGQHYAQDEQEEHYQGRLRYINNEVQERLEHIRLARAAGREVSEAIVSGRVFKEGKPWAGVTVLLGRKGFENQHPPDSGEYRTAVTDAEGRFTFSNVRSGSYVLGLEYNFIEVEGLVPVYRGPKVIVVDESDVQAGEFHFNQPVEIVSPKAGQVVEDGVLTVRWTPVPEAASYSIGLGTIWKRETGTSSSWRFIARNVSDTEYKLNLDELRWSGSVGISYDQQGVAPDALLGSLFPGSRHFLVVQAVDENGQEITSTEKLIRLSEKRPGEFAIAGELDEVENLIVSREYDKAIKQLEKRVAEDPEDVDALRILFRIRYLGTDIQGRHQDYGQAARLGERLVRLEPVAEARKVYKKWWAECYSKLGQYDKALTIRKQLMAEAETTGWDHRWIARLYLKTGDVGSALEHYRLGIRHPDHPTGVFREVLLVSLLAGEADVALQLLEGDSIYGESAATVKTLRQNRKLLEAPAGLAQAFSAGRYSEVNALTANSNTASQAFWRALWQFADLELSLTEARPEWQELTRRRQEIFDQYLASWGEENPALRQVLTAVYNQP